MGEKCDNVEYEVWVADNLDSVGENFKVAREELN